MREQEGLRSDIFRSYTSAKDTAGVIKALKKYGPEEPQLYIDALAYFSSSPKILAEAGDELDAVLKRIDEDGLMAPLQVVRTLSNNGVVTMGMVKKYLSNNIERERKEITNVCPILTPSIFPPSIFHLTSNYRTAASYQVIPPKRKPRRKKSTNWVPSPSFSKHDDALHAGVTLTYQLSISYASTRSTNAA